METGFYMLDDISWSYTPCKYVLEGTSKQLKTRVVVYSGPYPLEIKPRFGYLRIIDPCGYRFEYSALCFGVPKRDLNFGNLL